MKSYCLNVGDTYTLDYTLTAQHYAINDVEIVVTPSVALSLVGVTSTSGTGILVGNTFSIPTIPANDVEVLTITVAIEDSVTEDLTVEINATTTTVQSTTLDDTKIKDLDDIYIFQRRCLTNTNRYQVPNEAFGDIFNPQVDEVERWVNSNLIASQRAHAELYSIESENDLVITGSYDQNPDTTWDFGGTVDNKVSGFTINGTDYLTQFPYTDGSGNIVLDSAALEAYIEASLNLEGLGDKLTIAIDDSSDSSISVAFTITDPIEDLGDIDITIQGVSGSLLSTNPATYISTYTFTTEGSDVNNPDNIWSIVNDRIQLVFKRRNVEDTFYLDSSISDYRSALSQKGNPQRPFKNQGDVIGRIDFNIGDKVVDLLEDDPGDSILFWNGTQLVSLSTSINKNLQGYYALLSSYYFGGVGTQMTIAVEDTDTWLDIEMDIDPSGLSDFRPTDMQSAVAVGHTGDGSNGDPIIFNLEGLGTSASANFRASLSFDPDEDGGKLDSRMYVERHSAAVPSEDFFLEATGVAMESGAGEDYANYVNIQFFVGDTINTNGPGDAGKIRFQIKSSVAGVLSTNEIALFIQS